MNLHTDSLWIGRLLKNRLEELVPVYPCIAPDIAPEEYCVYRRVGFSSGNTKDLYNYKETLNMMVTVCSLSYDKVLGLAQKIKDRLDGLRGRFEGKPIIEFTMTNATEEYAGIEYIQNLFFSITFDTTKGK